MKNIHVITGEDEYLVGEAAKKILSGMDETDVIDSTPSSNEETRLADIESVKASVFTPPFLSPTKGTWWKNVGFLPQGGAKGPSVAVKESLERFADALAANPPPDGQILVITAPALLSTSLFAKKLKGAAEFQAFAPPKPWEKGNVATVTAIDAAKERGMSFAPGAAESFASVVGADTRSILSEMDKMRDWLGPERNVIEKSDVEAVSTPGAGVETPVWELADAMGARDLSRALRVADRNSGDSGFAIVASTLLERFFRSLAELKDAEANGRTEEIAASFGSPYALRKNLGFLRHWSARDLQAAWARFFLLREKAVSGGADAADLVVVELVRAARLRSGTGKATA